MSLAILYLVVISGAEVKDGPLALLGQKDSLPLLYWLELAAEEPRALAMVKLHRR